MALRNAVMAALLDGEASGYDLAKGFEASVANFWMATPQQVYRELGFGPDVTPESDPDLFGIADNYAGRGRFWLAMDGELAGLTIIVGAFGIGYLLGGRGDHLHDVGGLGTAQRNTAAALTIATENFTDPNVLVTVTLANLIGLVVLMLIARIVSRDNVVRIATA